MAAMVKIVAPSFIASLSMFIVVLSCKYLLAERFSTGLSLAIYCALGALIYLIFMITIFRAETRNFFVESSDFLPEKFKPAILTLQKLLRIS